MALGVGFIASVFLNFVQSQHASQDHKLLQGEITDLRYQVNLDKLAATGPTPSASPVATPEASPSPSPTPGASPSPSPSPAGAVAGDSTKTATVKKSGNIHVGASTTSKVLVPYTQLPVGTSVTLGSMSGKFQQITFNGTTGYILASYLQ